MCQSGTVSVVGTPSVHHDVPSAGVSNIICGAFGTSKLGGGAFSLVRPFLCSQSPKYEITLQDGDPRSDIIAGCCTVLHRSQPPLCALSTPTMGSIRCSKSSRPYRIIVTFPCPADEAFWPRTRADSKQIFDSALSASYRIPCSSFLLLP